MPEYQFDAERFCRVRARAARTQRNFQDEQNFYAVAEEVKRLRLIVDNIKVHFDKLCSHELRQHGVISPEHEIDFQVFRVLCGYKEALGEIEKLREAAKALLIDLEEHATGSMGDTQDALAKLVGEV